MAAQRKTRREVVKKTRHITLYKITRHKSTWYEITTFWFTPKAVIEHLNRLFGNNNIPGVALMWKIKNREEAYNKFLMAQLVC